MRGRHPARVLAGCWLVFAGILVLADCLLKPAPVTFTEAPTPTRAPVTVLPTATTFVYSAPTREVVVLDQLPLRPTSTRVPATLTPAPTATPTINPTPPTQKG